MLYGYAIKQENEHGLLSLREVTLTASPSVLRRVAKFLIQAAEEMEAEHPISPTWHRHIRSYDSAWTGAESELDIVVAAPSD